MLFWGLANFEIQEVTDFFLSREEAEAALSEIVADEPYFATILGLVEIDFGALSPRVRSMLVCR